MNRAARTAHRKRVWAVVTQERRRQLKGPLWFLPASNFVVLPDGGSTTYGVIMGLLRILERDPAAKVVLVPGSQAHELDFAGILAGSARELLQLIEVRVPDITTLGEAVVRGTNPDAEAELNARLLGVDFYLDVLSRSGRDEGSMAIPVARC